MITRKGYVYEHVYDYELAPTCGQVMIHRKIFEETRKCCMLDWGDVHHINGVKTDNRPENLEGMMHGKHSTISKKRGNRSNRICLRCGSTTTRIQVQIKKGHEYIGYIWHAVNDGFYCDRCAKKTGVAYNR